MSLPRGQGLLCAGAGVSALAYLTGLATIALVMSCTGRIPPSPLRACHADEDWEEEGLSDF